MGGAGTGGATGSPDAGTNPDGHMVGAGGGGGSSSSDAGTDTGDGAGSAGNTGSAGNGGNAGAAGNTGGAGNVGTAGMTGMGGTTTGTGGMGMGGTTTGTGGMGMGGTTTGTGGTGDGGSPGTGGAGPGGAGGTTPASISLVMTANPDPAVQAGFISYKVRITNTGGSTLTNVVLTESTQNGAQTLAAEITGGGGCGNSSACVAGVIITWPAFTLAAGQTQTVSFLSQVLGMTVNGTLIHNTATLNFPGGSLMTSRDVLVDGTQALRLTLTEDRDPVRAGDQLTYTVIAGNTGTQSLPLDAAGVISAAIPANTTFVSASTGGIAANGLVQWNVGSIDAGGTRRFTYTVAVNGGLADGTLLSARAEVLDNGASQVRATAQTQVRSSPPIKLTMIANPDPGVPAGFVLYEMRLTNTTSGTLTNIALSEQTLNNAQTLAAEITGGGGCGNSSACVAGVIVTWPAFTLAAGQTQIITFLSQVLGTAPDGAIMHNVATAAYPGGTVSQGYDVIVDSNQGLHLGITEDHDPVQPGDTLTYTIVVGNTASQSLPLSAAGVVSATIPVGTTFVSASTGGTANGNLVQWNVGSVDAGGNRRFTFTVAAASNLADGTVLTARAELLDGTVSQVRAAAAAGVRATAPVTLTMIANPDPAVSAGFVSYELKLTNTTASTLTNVVLTESTLNGAQTLAPEITNGGGCGNSSACVAGVIIGWPAFTLGPGQTQTVRFLNQVLGTAANGTVIRNAASVAYPGGTVSQTKDLLVSNTQGLHLAISEDHDPAKPGDAITYTIVTGNTGSQSLPLSAAGVLTATIPTGTTLVSASTGSTTNGSLVQWNVGSVDAGGSRRFTYSVAAGAALPDGAVLLAHADLLDGTVSQVRAATATEIRAASPVRVTMIANPDPIVAAGFVNYEIKISNTTGGTLTNIVLTEQTLNGAQTLAPEITSGGGCSNSSACVAGVIVTWPAFTLAAGQTQTVTFLNQVLGTTGNGTLIRSAASVAYPGGTVSQNTDLMVNGAQGLHLGMVEDHDPVKPGDQITYTIVATNTASQSLPLSAGGVLTATIPPGTAFVAASAGGAQSGNVVRWTVGSVDTGGSQTRSFTVIADAALAEGTVLQVSAELLDGTVSQVRSTTATEVKVASPLTLTLMASPNPAAPTALVAYVLTATNVSASTLTNVVLSNAFRNSVSIPAGTITNGGGCNNTAACGAGVIVTWPTFTLGPGQSQTVSFSGQVIGGTLDGTLVRDAATLNYPGGTVSQSHDLVVHH